MKKLLSYFSRGELILWASSVTLILVSFLIFDRENYLTLIASLIGGTALIFNAKGNPVGQGLIIIFSILYAVISYSFAYYGEMITYLGMSAPMAVVALVSWLKNPYNGNRAEVKVNKISGRETVFMAILTIIVTIVFYFILKNLGTANIVPSTFSVTTSFAAAYLTFRRSPYYALAYAANDGVLLILWTMAAFKDVSYLSVIICFAMFLVNDIYGFINWEKMQKKQAKN
ncbi:MAG: nicotinamide riboside transporter PnuC [Ruminococcus sp.]|nr:nicotinamide riboside transporter PnuC [Ruminococcus sp.]MCM1380778.1 nicotinamide riboside transporter PnuC [Muribaculaceae bacterium]MCM1479335.1 nicotinamide riboside transporter PnuC [Muribaculaceae bacterium]